MPTLLVVENTRAVTARVRRQLESAVRRGWTAKLVLRNAPSDTGQCRDEPWETISLSSDLSHPLSTRRRDVIDGMARELKATRGIIEERKTQLAAISGADAGEGAFTEVLRNEVSELRASSKVIANRKRVLHEATRTPTPYGRPAHFGDPLRLESFWYELAALLVSLEWDVAQAADLDALPPIIWASRACRRRVAVVYDAHELYPELAHLPEVHREAWREIARTFMPLADSVISASDTMAEALERRYGAPPATAIWNCPVVGKDEVASVRSQARIAPSSPTAVHIGALRPNRRVERLIDMAVAMPELHVVCLGAVPDADGTRQLKSLADRTGVGNRVHLLPPVPHDLVVSAIRTVDLSVITYGPDDANLASTLPNKFFEALAAGLPIVAAEGTAAADHILRWKIGRTFHPDDPGASAEAIRCVIGDPGYRERARVLSAYCGWDSVENHYVQILDNVLPRQG